MEATTPLLRGFARHLAIETGDPNLFHKFEAVSRNFEAPADWSTQWWEVPFAAIVGALRDGYAGVPDAEHYLQVLDQAMTLEELHDEFRDEGIAVDPDPYAIARRNKDGLNETLANLHDLHRLWVKFNCNAVAPLTPPNLSVELDPSAYLLPWSHAELLRRSLLIIADSRFTTACNGCASLDEVREHLGLDRQAVEAKRRERREQQQERNANDGHSTLQGLPSGLERQALANSFNVSAVCRTPTDHGRAEMRSRIWQRPLVPGDEV